MQLSAVLTAVGFATSVYAQTVVGTIHDITTNLGTILPQYESAVITSAEAIAGSVSAQAAIAAQAALNANLTNIVTALVSAGTQIAGVTVNVAGTITNSTVGLVQADINTLAADVETIANLIQGIEVTVSVITHLGGNAAATAAAELAILNNVIAPFVAPIQAYVAAVLTSYANATLTITGLKNAQADLTSVVKTTTGIIGL